MTLSTRDKPVVVAAPVERKRPGQPVSRISGGDLTGSLIGNIKVNDRMTRSQPYFLPLEIWVKARTARFFWFDIGQASNGPIGEKTGTKPL